MTYVINEPCIGAKDTSCVEVCPVDCIHPTPDEPGFEEAEQLYIDPEECIDCDACVEACPGRRDHPRGPGAARVAALHREERRLLPTRPEMNTAGHLRVGSPAEAPSSLPASLSETDARDSAGRARRSPGG